MKVFVTGATGAIGAQLIPQLVARGHDVVGMTRWRISRDACARSAPSRSWPTRWTQRRCGTP